MTEKTDKEVADSVLEVSIWANKQVAEELMGDEGIRMAIDTLREFGHENSEIRTAVMKKYNISTAKVDKYL